jgi:hypothetical protein
LKTGQAKRPGQFYLPIDPLVVEFPATKAELARIWDVARNTVRHWDAIAVSTIPAYRKAYPVKKGTTATPNTYVLLQPYQIWVLWRIRFLLQRSRNAEYAKDYIRQNREQFSTEKFKEEIYPSQTIAA